jgi:hypothetical protein
MNDQDLEKALEGTADSGNPEEAIARGGGVAVVARRKRKRFFSYLIPLVSVAMAISIAVPLTWYYAKKTSLPDDTGAGGSNDPIAYMKLYSKYYYPYSIGSFSQNEIVYGNLFYSFNNQYEQYFTVHLFEERSSAVEIFASDNTLIAFSQADNSHFTFSGTTFTFHCVFTDLSGNKITMDSLTVDVKPYYDLVMSWN